MPIWDKGAIDCPTCAAKRSVNPQLGRLYSKRPPSSNNDLPEVLYSMEPENDQPGSPLTLRRVSSTSLSPQTSSKEQPTSSNNVQSEKQEDEGIEKTTSACLPQRMFVNLPPEVPANLSHKKSRGESSQIEEEFVAYDKDLPRKKVTRVHAVSNSDF